MTTMRVKFKPCTASDEMAKKMRGLGLVQNQFKMTESSENVVSFATVTVPDDDVVSFRRKFIMLPQVECIEH